MAGGSCRRAKSEALWPVAGLSAFLWSTSPTAFRFQVSGLGLRGEEGSGRGSEGFGGGGFWGVRVLGILGFGRFLIFFFGFGGLGEFEGGEVERGVVRRGIVVFFFLGRGGEEGGLGGVLGREEGG